MLRVVYYINLSDIGYPIDFYSDRFIFAAL